MGIIKKSINQATALLTARKNLADAAMTLVVRVLAAMLAFGVQVFLARSLNLDDYGIYVTLWTWLIVANHIATFGFTQSSLRFLPRYTQRHQYDWALGFLKTGFLFSTLGAAVVGVSSFFLLSFFSEQIPTNYLIAMMVLAVGLPVMALELYLEGVSRAFGWYMLTVVPAFVMRPLAIAFGVFVAMMAGFEPDAAMVLTIVIVATGLGLIIQLAIIRHRLIKLYGKIHGGKPRKFWVTSSLPLLLASSIDELYMWSDIMVLGFMVSAPDVAVYFAAQRSMSLASFIQYAFMMVSAREFSLASAMRDIKELQSRISSATRWTFWMSVPAVLLTLVFSYPLMLMFGKQFLSGIPVMVVLGAGLLIRASVGQASDLLIILGHQYANMFISLGGLICNVILSIALVPYYGILGAAIATSITYVLRAIALTVVTHKLSGLWVFTDMPESITNLKTPIKMVEQK